MTVAPRPVQRTFYAPALDGVRALAFLLVFASHVPGLVFVPGGFAVTVFFFLSGFLITTLLRLEHAATGRIDVRAFFLRRFLRILPPYYLTLALLVALGASEVTWQGLAAQAAFLGNYWVATMGKAGIAPGSEVYWSLAVEEHFYLLFPFAAAALLRSRSARSAGWVLLGVCELVLLWRAIVFVGTDPAHVARIAYRTDTRLDSILVGAACALLWNPAVDRPGPFVRALGSRTASALAAGGIVLTLLPRDPWFRETVRYSAQGLLLVPLYCGLLLRPEGRVARALAHPWLRWLGALSYTLYLVHDAALHHLWHGLRGALPVWLIGGLALAASIAYAELVRRWVERPLARWRAALRPGGST